MSPERFHPAVSTWLSVAFTAPTPVQIRAWEALREPRDLLVAAPTGAGKTLAAFLAVIDELVRQGVENRLAEGVQIVYVSPLKALSNDIQCNLEQPLAGIQEALAAGGFPAVPLRTAVRTGDTPQISRTLMRRNPPQILVTTPESLYILLTSESGRDMLKTTRTIIVDEIHAVAGTKRGAHLALSLERLSALTAQRPRRIGLSATQRPLEEVARFLCGTSACESLQKQVDIIDEGHARTRDLALELPSAPLEAVLSAESASEMHDRIAELILEHRTTLVFVNTRRMAERVAKALSDRIGNDLITSHHGSMSRELRLQAEQRLKAGQLRALVATASLELGIDVGEVDLVCQIGSTRTLATLLQRVGRSGHRLDALIKGRLFPQSRDELVECAALLDMTRRGELDRLTIAGPALDVLAQQIVAEVAARGECSFDALLGLMRGAYCYRALSTETFSRVLDMLAEGYAFARGRRSAYLHLDRINRQVRPRPGARLVAITCGGAIPDTADYDVLVEPSGQFVGTVNEDFAIDSMPGSIFQLGNSSWRIVKIEQSAVRVADAAAEPPNMPFWVGEAPARSDELSTAVSRLRADFDLRLLATAGEQRAATLLAWLREDLALGRSAAEQIYEYLAGGRLALGVMPTQHTLVLERFFDESGGMQLVIHSPFGTRINRAWGLALRKRFCRQFNFELQAAAVEDAIVISLGAIHSFPLEDVWRFLKAATVRQVLTQALLDAPMFPVRWRWVACCALAIQRSRFGKRTPPRLLRMSAEDLVSLVFPDQLACAENLTGAREIPDHPLVAQAIDDCLSDVMDCTGLEALLRAIEAGEKELVARDLTEPSPFAQAVLNANPYAFLDDAPLEERRTQAVQSRRWLDPALATDLGALDPQAIARVIAEVWPSPRNRDELHEALDLLGAVSPSTLAHGPRGELAEVDEARLADWYEVLAGEGRALTLHTRGSSTGGLGSQPADEMKWLAAERCRDLCGLWPGAALIGAEPPAELQLPTVESPLLALVRGWMEVCGPVTVQMLAAHLGQETSAIEQQLHALEAQGIVMRGQYSPGVVDLEWCERRLLARIHRYTLNRLRAEIEPVAAADFLRFLFEWQYAAGGQQVEGTQATAKVLEMLAGFEAPAAAWEQAILPLRIKDYSPSMLDRLSGGGRVSWLRLRPREGGKAGAQLLRTSPISFVPRGDLRAWLRLHGGDEKPELSGVALAVQAFLQGHGASFFDDIAAGTRLLRTQCEQALSELVTAGLATSDNTLGLRVLLTPSAKRRPLHGQRRRRAVATGIEDTGRWALLAAGEGGPEQLPYGAPDLEPVARSLLQRYGVVFRRLLERENCAQLWRPILQCLRRMEARGEIRGGRFVAGFAGEQFALPEVVAALRRVRASQASGVPVLTSAADPLNLVGILTPGVRVPTNSQAVVAWLDGEPVATRLAGQIHLLKTLDAAQEMRVRTALIARRSSPQAARRKI
ncbi:MAG: DEAD/DEAH box helicase [Gammaproteobacteria bacterium]|nr:DEAD/DEAH box helicase [Gammaproteobacteria bacterium]